MWHGAGGRGHAGRWPRHGRGLHRNRVLLLLLLRSGLLLRQRCLRGRGLLVLGRQQACGQRASRWRRTGAWGLRLLLELQ